MLMLLHFFFFRGELIITGVFEGRFATDSYHERVEVSTDYKRFLGNSSFEENGNNRTLSIMPC